MENQPIYKKNDQVWLRTSLKGVPGQIRPATVISVVNNKQLYQPEQYVVVRFDDAAYPAHDFECLPASRIMGLREAAQDDDTATDSNNNEPNRENNYEKQQP